MFVIAFLYRLFLTGSAAEDKETDELVAISFGRLVLYFSSLNGDVRWGGLIQGIYSAWKNI